MSFPNPGNCSGCGGALLRYPALPEAPGVEPAAGAGGAELLATMKFNKVMELPNFGPAVPGVAPSVMKSGPGVADSGARLSRSQEILKQAFEDTHPEEDQLQATLRFRNVIPIPRASAAAEPGAEQRLAAGGSRIGKAPALVTPSAAQRRLMLFAGIFIGLVIFLLGFLVYLVWR